MSMADHAMQARSAARAGGRHRSGPAVAALAGHQPGLARHAGAAPAVPTDADAALERLCRAVRLILREPEAAELTVPILAALLVLAEGRVTPSVEGLAAHLGVSPSITWKAVYALETRALLTRLRNPENGRLVLFAPTEKGRALIGRAGAAAALRG